MLFFSFGVLPTRIRDVRPDPRAIIDIRSGAATPGFRSIRVHGVSRRPAAGRGWVGITPRAAYVTSDVHVSAVLPGWVWLLLAAGLSVAAWLVEGRRRRSAR